MVGWIFNLCFKEIVIGMLPPLMLPVSARASTVSIVFSPGLRLSSAVVCGTLWKSMLTQGKACAPHREGPAGDQTLAPPADSASLYSSHFNQCLPVIFGVFF